MANDEKFDFGWDMSVKDETERLRLQLHQWHQMAKFLMKGRKMSELPDMGTDEGGSESSFDWWMLNDFEARKLLEGYQPPWALADAGRKDSGES